MPGVRVTKLSRPCHGPSGRRARSMELVPFLDCGVTHRAGGFGRFPPVTLMRSFHRYLLAACAATLLALAACRFDPAGANGEAVTSLRFAPSAFDSFRRNAELRYTLAHAATVRVRIVRRGAGGEETTVKTLAASARETRGAHAITWLGDTAERFFAPAGIYLGVVETGGERYEASVEVFHF